MLIIRNEQIEVISRIPLMEFENSLVEFVQKFYHREYEDLGRRRVYRVVRDCIFRAKEYGYGSKRQVTYYLGLMMLLGSRFDKDLQLAWARDMLTDRDIVSPTERIARLWKETVRYLEKTAGENNEHLIKALIRAKNLIREDKHHLSGMISEDDWYSLLGRIYPQKFDYQGESVNRRLIRESIKTASDFGLADADGIITVLFQMFFLGSFFHLDILHHWAGEILQDPGISSPRERIGKLRQAIFNRIEQALRDKYSMGMEDE